MEYDVPLLAQSDHRAAVGNRLRRLIKAIGMKYTEAADIMRVSKQTLNGWMKGDGYPDQYGVYCLCRVHKVNYDYLFLGDWTQLPSWLADKLKPDFSDLPASPPQNDADPAGSAGDAPADASAPAPEDGGKRGPRKRHAHHTP